MLGIILLVLSPQGVALDKVSIGLGKISGAGWEAHGAVLEMNWHSASAAEVSLSLEQFTLPDPIGKLGKVSIRCPQATLLSDAVACEEASVQLVGADKKPKHILAALRYRLTDQFVDLRLRDVPFADGRANVRMTGTSKAWAIEYDVVGIDGAALALLLRPSELLPDGFTVNSRITLKGSARGAGSIAETVSLEALIERLAFSSADGVQAAENLRIETQVSLDRKAQGWEVRSNLTARGGTLCLSTCWELPQAPVNLGLDAHWSEHDRLLTVRRLSFNHPEVTRGEIEAAIRLAEQPQLASLSLYLAESDLSALYATWLQPALIGTPLDTLAANGRISARIEYDATRPTAARLVAKQVDIEDGKGRFGLSGIEGVIDWSVSGPPRLSEIGWHRGHWYRLPIGSSRVTVESHDNAFMLANAARIPILDGELQVDELQFERAGTEQLRWRVEGFVTPISMEALSEALAWPTMAGKLSGVVPSVEYRDGVLQIEGVLLVRVFDGSVTIRDLRLARPFGVAPVLNANIDLNNLDLEALTRTFSFGTIRGRLSGQVHDLVLSDWRPAAFDARFATPAEDRSTRRISQRAVENLTSLGGGGMSGALSRTLMGMFDEFSYRRIGIACRLEQGVCEMSGVAPAENGYYIVQGGGLPRIDVIGYETRVDWETLLQRLDVITATGGAVVQ